MRKGNGLFWLIADPGVMGISVIIEAANEENGPQREADRRVANLGVEAAGKDRCQVGRSSPRTTRPWITKEISVDRINIGCGRRIKHDPRGRSGGWRGMLIEIPD